ncbi:helix-turn-helix domain-containing protein [Devosia sp. SL43]|uniref:helix-turn-helix domain-containing protein n=1 Tax=Devosia sp. SL43 TaxID=2806348 RepID=UPI001F3571AC|nr:helix-turn-helix domain-containing protein [Devosia sp. SL43]UJW87920.1 helix-turn-helix domain-containing protein [Devosia sp. SL43]
MENLIKWLDEKRGRRGDLTRALKITPGALSQWSQVPATRATEVSAVTGIPLHELRPDVFPAPKSEGAAA